MKPLIDLAHFRRLDLRIATVIEVRALESMPHLVRMQVLTDGPLDVLALASNASVLTTGARILVATALYPLKVAGSEFTALFIGALVPSVAASDGSRVT